MYTAWARERGYDVTASEQDGVFSVHVAGAYAFGYLRGEEGGHRVVMPPASKAERRGEAYLARVEVLAPGEPAREAVRLEDVAPIRTYDLWRSHGVRDRVTGTVDGDVRRVLDGRLAPFLEAHADTRTS